MIMNIARKIEWNVEPNTEVKNQFDLNEQQLIAGLKAGDVASFEILVKDYGGRMLATARRYLHNEADAQDCVQDAYIQAFRKIYSFEGRASIATWLHRIVVNTALMKIRSVKRLHEEFVDDNSILFDGQGIRIETDTELSLSVEDVLLNKETQQSMRQTIDKLPDIARRLILLRDIEGYSALEVAQSLSMSVGSVKTGLHRARKRLKTMIQINDPKRKYLVDTKK